MGKCITVPVGTMVNANVGPVNGTLPEQMMEGAVVGGQMNLFAHNDQPNDDGPLFPNGIVVAGAAAAINDRFIVDLGQFVLCGGPGCFITANANFVGDLSASGGGAASAQLVFRLINVTQGTPLIETIFSQDCNALFGVCSLNSFGGVASSNPLFVQSGDEVDLVIEADVAASVDLANIFGGPGSATADLMGTIEWLGLTVRDEFGDPVPGATAFSPTSGFDYVLAHPFVAQPPPNGQVPEPGTLALFAFGLAGLGFLRRRFRT